MREYMGMKDQNKEYLNDLRHSTAHLLAAAVEKLYPDAKRTIGPPIDEGFYYDFDFGDVKVSEEDFPNIEKKMLELLPAWKGFERHMLSESEALKQYPGNPYKKELIEEFSEHGKKEISFYKSGDYWDLCKGGHVEHPDKQLRHFKLLKIAGAYWRGNEKNKMLTRIYGTAFANKQELDDYLKNQEEAKKRDHRKLGKELDFFSTNPLTGQGLILWHPKLAVVRNIIEDYWRKEHYKKGYQLVFTPHIASMDMFVLSRHLSKYINYMFPIMFHENIEGESAPDYTADEVLKPMNCPNHIQIYKAYPRSYRELPLRIGELGTVYRYERAGVLYGMLRVRGFTQDDSHIFCTPDQAIEEVKNVLQIMKQFYSLFGFSDYKAFISTRPEKYLGDLSLWEHAESALKKAAGDERFTYEIDEGGGAFYGPKIDLKVKDSLGREWQLGTVQFDFNQPSKAETTDEEIEEFWALKTFKQRFKTKENLTKYLKKLGRGFNVTYIAEDGTEKQCIMIHRVVLGSMERFMGILIEHYGGRFPLWLAPLQVTLIPIADRHNEAVEAMANILQNEGIRVSVDKRSASMQGKIRDATLQKVPFLGIIGDREITENAISVRNREGQNLGSMSVDDFVKDLKNKIEKKL